MSFADGVLTVSGDTTCAEVEEQARPWLFAADTPELTVAEWIGRGGGDLLWEWLGPTRAQVLGIRARLPGGDEVTFGGKVVKNVAGYDLTRVFVGARGDLGEVIEAHLRVRPPPRGWRAAVRRGTEREEARGCAVWNGDTWRFLRCGEDTPDGYEELDALEARTILRDAWKGVRSFDGTDGVWLAGPRVCGSTRAPAARDDPLWERLRGALCRS